ncbi:antiviral RADAR system accessory protein RdrD [Aeromonas veronii]|uniref:antiviral RADAR system accessory protein RdrD n=1 Tax=Aeromonas veronii TaxID=654 RepID=UPI0011C346B4|nr:antiviral RADAR system accessory protein RdrD [Aeromonas veronii]
MHNSNLNVTPINDYTSLISQLKTEQQRLNKKSLESYWLRYTFRRIPLLFGSGFIFFAVCLGMAMFKEIGLNTVNSFLNGLISFDVGCLNYIFGGVLLLLFLRGTIPCGSKYVNTTWHKVITNISLLTLSLATFFIVIRSQHPLIFGLAVFSFMTIFSILLDRTLGFTRRNERYQLFANRAEGLCILFASRGKLNIEFAESHLLELAQYYEQLRLSKYNDTISDSHYLLAQLEQLKGISK